jgi:hypothetical protein
VEPNRNRRTNRKEEPVTFRLNKSPNRSKESNSRQTGTEGIATSRLNRRTKIGREKGEKEGGEKEGGGRDGEGGGTRRVEE